MPSKIEWTDETWNPVTGCTKVSAGCANCYAERMARRLAGRYGYPKKPDHFDVTLHPDRLDVPLRWRKPRMVFVDSMGDLFHKDVPEDFIVSVFARMIALTEHTFQVLTKRSERMLDFITRRAPGVAEWSNIWLGVSVEDQAAADERIPLLLQTPAAVRGVSCEPLLESIDATKYLLGTDPDGRGEYPVGSPKVDWLIVGGESGPGARPMHPDWARLLRDQAQAAGVPFFFKQWGAWLNTDGSYTDYAWEQVRLGDKGGTTMRVFEDGTRMLRVGKKRAGRLLDGREWNEMPEFGSDKSCTRR